MRGSRCARFEVRTVARREDIYNLLLLICYKGGALWDYHATICLLPFVMLNMYWRFEFVASNLDDWVYHY